MITSYAQNPVPTFFDDDGKPLVGGLIKTFVAGTNNPVATYNSSGALNPTTIQLNSRGEYPQGICLDITREYKFKLYRADNSEVWTKDHVKAQGTATIEVKGIDTIIADVDGNTGVPSVDVSFNENIANIEFHNLKGEKGEKGEKGATGSEGKAGENGKTWLPSVSAAGDLSWTQSDSETAPTPRNIKGPKGDKGSDASVTAEAVNALTGLTISTSGNAATATKATGDSDGNNIKTTYATKQEVQSAIESVHTHSNKSELDKIADGDVAKWNGKYSKPSGGIPNGDLAQSVQTSLGKADTALQASAISDMETKTHASSTYQPKGDYLTTETDPTVPAWAKAESKPSYTASDVGAAPAIHNHNDLYYTESEIDTKLGDKVDKVSGKGLSANDFTTTLKNKLDGIASGAEVNVQSDWNQTDSSKDDYIKNKPTSMPPTAHTHNGSDITSKVGAATTADSAGILNSTALANNTDLNTIKGSSRGVRWYSGNAGSNTYTNIPSGLNNEFILGVTNSSNNNYCLQTIFAALNGIWTRKCNNGTWTSWVKVMNQDCTFPISITGNAASATTADSAHKLNPKFTTDLVYNGDKFNGGGGNNYSNIIASWNITTSSDGSLYTHYHENFLYSSRHSGSGILSVYIRMPGSAGSFTIDTNPIAYITNYSADAFDSTTVYFLVKLRCKKTKVADSPLRIKYEFTLYVSAGDYNKFKIYGHANSHEARIPINTADVNYVVSNDITDDAYGAVIATCDFSRARTSASADNCNYSGSNSVDTLVVKRTYTGGGAYVRFNPKNQDTEYWRCGSSTEGDKFIIHKGEVGDVVVVGHTSTNDTLNIASVKGASVKASGASGEISISSDNGGSTRGLWIGAHGTATNGKWAVSVDTNNNVTLNGKAETATKWNGWNIVVDGAVTTAANTLFFV